MNILIVSATEFEIAEMRWYIPVKENVNIDFLITGVGMINTTFELTKCLSNKSYDYAINLGIAGAFDRNIEIGDCVWVRKDLFSEMGIMNHVEVEARYEIELEEYTKKIQIEGRVLGDISRNHVIPTAIRYQNTLIENVKGLKEIFGAEFENIAREQIVLIKEISSHIEGINSKVAAMINERKKANNLTDAQLMADAYCNEVRPYFEEIRNHCDKLELLVDDETWTLTKYRELLFTK